MTLAQATRWIPCLAGAGLLLCATGVAMAQERATTMSFPASTSAITVDVIVQDKEGRPVRGLTKEDFGVSEDGQAQPIVAFEERLLTATPSAPPSPPARVVTNAEASARTGRVIAFVIDDLGLDPVRGGADVQKAVARWLREKADPSDEVAIATTSGDLWWTDVVARGRADLLAVLTRARGKKGPHEARESISDWEASEIVVRGRSRRGLQRSPARSARVAGPGEAPPVGIGGPPEMGNTELGGVLRRVIARWSKPSGPCDGMSAGMCQLLVQRRSEEVQDRTVRRRRALVRLVDRLSQALMDRRGRKSIVLFSEGFIELPQVGPDEKALDAARRANVAVYFVDARGLTTQSFYSAENGSAPVKEDIGLATLDLGVLSVAGGENLAQATGGFTVQSNDLFDGVTRAADESSAYYLLGYQPEKEADGKWHGLKVSVKRQGVKVRARQGYYATSGPRRSEPSASASQSSAAAARPGPARRGRSGRDPAAPHLSDARPGPERPAHPGRARRRHGRAPDR